MKPIKEYIDEYKAFQYETSNLIDEIDNEIINESFQCTILKEINQYLEKIIAIDKEKEKTEKYYSKKGRKFRKIFDNAYYGIQWDKITDDMVKEYSIDDEEGIKLVKRICSNRSNSFPGLIILKTDNENVDYKYPGMLISIGWGASYISLISSYGKFIGKSSNVRPSEVTGFLTNKFYIVDLSSLSSFEIQMNRRKSRDGMIYQGDENFYKKIAISNLDRYKKYAAKITAERESNDGIPEKVNAAIQKVMDFVSEFSTDPMKYSSCGTIEYDIQYLLNLTSDKKIWVNNKNNGYYSGRDGILTVFARYLTAKIRQVQGKAMDYEIKDYENSKKKINEIIDAIDKKINEINTKISSK